MSHSPSWAHPRHLVDLLNWLTSLGFSSDPVPIPERDLPLWALEEESLEELTLLYAGCHPTDPDFQILLAEHRSFGAQGADLLSWQSRWAGRLWRRNRTFSGLLVSAGPHYRDILVSLVFPEGLIHRPGLRHVRLEADALRPADLERVERLRLVPSDLDGPALAQRLSGDLDVSLVTREFFRRFKRAHRALSVGLTGVEDARAEDRDALALTILSRLLFLYFLERKELLDGNRRYLSETLSGLESQVFRTFLQPLFFEVLNAPEASRSAAARRLGAIPYLNGGLFERTELERTHPDLNVPDTVIRPIFSNLLERYAFTTRADGEGVGVDPAMLGRAFEALMATAERGATGTFYTPRPLVDAAVSDALVQTLIGAGATSMEASTLVSGEVPLSLEVPTASELRQAIDRVTILDPACGSGAFLLGAMSALEVIHMTLAEAAERTPPSRASLRRRIVSRNLYGVDLNPAAVQICELRLWLAVLDAEEGRRVAPLPNLDHRVRRGDILLEPIDWTCAFDDLQEVSDRVDELEDLKQEYALATAVSKRAVRQIVELAETDLYRRMIEAELGRAESHRAALQQIALAPDLFEAEPRPSRAMEIELDKAARRIDELEVSLALITEGGQCPGFSPAIHFPEVTAAGGFDVVVANPPWVRIHAIAPAQRARLKRRYDVARRGAWTADGMLVGLKGFGSQVDLSACFVERSVELLADGGTLAMILPSKLLRTLYGGGLRRLLTTRCAPTKVVEIDEGAFPDASTYPCLVVANKASCSPTSMVWLSSDIADRGSPVPLGDLSIHPGDLAAPWIVGPRRSSVVADLMQRKLAVAQHPSIRLSRGVFTGLNEAFLIPAGEARGELARHMVPVVRGADLGPFRWRVTDELVWTHRDNAAPLAALPPAIATHLGPYRPRLQARSDLRNDPAWWRIFRATPNLFGPKVAWRDMGKRLEAVALPAEDPRGRALVPLNTVYFIGVSTWEQALVLAAWMNSHLVREMAATVAERANSGYLRFFGWVISLLPLPDALAEALRSPDDWKLILAADPWLSRLLDLAMELDLNPPGPGEVTDELDNLVDALYRAERGRQWARRLVS